MNEFEEQAHTGEEALAHFFANGECGYVYVQWSADEDCWDYCIFDDATNEVDGGQFSLSDDGAPIGNAYDALSTLLYDAYGIYDISDEDTVEFMDPEDRYDFAGF